MQRDQSYTLHERRKRDCRSAPMVGKKQAEERRGDTKAIGRTQDVGMGASGGEGEGVQWFEVRFDGSKRGGEVLISWRDFQGKGSQPNDSPRTSLRLCNRTTHTNAVRQCNVVAIAN